MGKGTKKEAVVDPAKPKDAPYHEEHIATLKEAMEYVLARAKAYWPLDPLNLEVFLGDYVPPTFWFPSPWPIDDVLDRIRIKLRLYPEDLSGFRIFNTRFFVRYSVEEKKLITEGLLEDLPETAEGGSVD